MKVLVTGDRNWTNKKVILRELKKIKGLELVIEGGARGADTLAAECAQELGVPVCIFPANWNYYHRAAGPIRNDWMLKYGQSDLVLAFHNDLDNSKGTKDMVSKAKAAGVKVKLIEE